MRILGLLCRAINKFHLRVASSCHSKRLRLSCLSLQLVSQLGHGVVFIIELIESKLFEVVFVDALLPKLFKLVHDFDLSRDCFFLRLVSELHQLYLFGGQHLGALGIKFNLFQNERLLVFAGPLYAFDVFFTLFAFDLYDLKLEHLLVFFLLA